MSDTDKIRDHMQTALDALLAAFVINGGDLGDDTPDTALVAALSADPSVGIARQTLGIAMSGLDRGVLSLWPRI